MPIYEYQCAKCKKVHEIWQKITEANATKCPDAKCGGKVERLISASGFALKGTGWYKTDYERKGKKDSGPSADSDSGKTESASDPKPAPASEGSEKKKEPSDKKKKKDAPASGSSEKKKDSSGSDKKAQAA